MKRVHVGTLSTVCVCMYCGGRVELQRRAAAGDLMREQGMRPPATSLWPLNGITNPCRDAAVHTIGLPSMWRNIPGTHCHPATENRGASYKKERQKERKKNADRIKDELSLCR